MTLTPTLTTPAAPAPPAPRHATTSPSPQPAAPGHRASLDAALSAMDAVDLATLTEHASLLTRVDRKYLVPVHRAADMLTQLNGARVLDIDSRRAFAYSSAYFDTPALDSYFSAAHRRRRRFKIRTRSYLDTASAYLEVKTRSGRGATVKERLTIDPDDAARLDRPSRERLAELLQARDVANPRQCRALAFRLAAVLGSRYDRSTVWLPGDDARLTLDTHLRWVRLAQLTSDTTQAPRAIATRQAGALAVVETKGGATPSQADRWLWHHGYRPVRISKYATGLALLEPGLPSNRWHRVMEVLRESGAQASHPAGHRLA